MQAIIVSARSLGAQMSRRRHAVVCLAVAVCADLEQCTGDLGHCVGRTFAFEGGPCSDEHVDCAQRAARGDCASTSNEHMRSRCRGSCPQHCDTAADAEWRARVASLEMHRAAALSSAAYPAWGGRESCKSIAAAATKSRADRLAGGPFMHVAGLAHGPGTGSMGNHLSHYFQLRAAAHYGGFHFVMLDWSGFGSAGRKLPTSLLDLLPHVVPAERRGDVATFTSACLAASHFPHLLPFEPDRTWGAMSDRIAHDISAGVTAWARNVSTPLEYDDVIVHVRCGGQLLKAGRAEYGLMPVHHVVSALREQKIRSIGVMSTNFTAECPKRHAGAPKCPNVDGFGCAFCVCADIVDGYIDRLRREFPTARVSNRMNGSVLEDVSRIATAQHVFCGPSTFCVWTALAAERAYFPPMKLFPAMTQIAQNTARIRIIEQGFLSYRKIRDAKMSVRRILDFGTPPARPAPNIPPALANMNLRTSRVGQPNTPPALAKT